MLYRFARQVSLRRRLIHTYTSTRRESESNNHRPKRVRQSHVRSKTTI